MAAKLECDHPQSKKRKQELLADFIKNVHGTLRKNVYKAHGDFQSVWKQHCEDHSLLNEYAVAMSELAIEHWGGNNLQRIEWCKTICVEYYYDGGLDKCIAKDHRRVLMNLEHHQNCNCLNNIQQLHLTNRPVEKMDKLILLDVGSCFNPFRTFPEIFVPVGIDLCPGDKTVFKCDFLDLEVTCQKDPDHVHEDVRHPTIPGADTFPDQLRPYICDGQIKQLPGQFFGVVVFCLLLSYLPAKEQRFECCRKAHRLLKDGGLLLIITPDSSHQNKNMKMIKSWKTAIEAIGFIRWKYYKSEHTHCMAFRKKAPCRNLIQEHDTESLSQMLYIHQDSQDLKEHDQHEINYARTENDKYDFSGLPFSTTDVRDEQ